MRAVAYQLMRAIGAPCARIFLLAMRLTGRRAGLAVVLHRVGDPPGDFERELVPSLGVGAFERQVRFAASAFRLVPARDLRRAIEERRRGERLPLALTFDDDLASHHRVAAPVLRRLGAPATFFLNGASLDGPHRFWWQALQQAVDEDLADELLPATTGGIHEVAMRVQLMERPRKDALAARLEALLEPPAEDLGLRAADVGELAAAGFEIGFHTRLHPYLPGLDDAELDDAMRDGRRELEAVAGRPIETIAYPHGGADERVADAARRAGFALGFTTRPAAITPATDALLMGRVENSFRSTGHFAVRLVRALLRA